jgi:class 3 adenylate cyclase
MFQSYNPFVGDGGAGRSSTATVLFTDLAGSTEIRRRLGDDGADGEKRA